VPGARFAPFALRNSHSQLRHDIHFGAMLFSVPQPIALFAYGQIGPNRDGRTLYLLWNIALDALDAIERAGEGVRSP
jgi:hypothetical protein